MSIRPYLSFPGAAPRRSAATVQEIAQVKAPGEVFKTHRQPDYALFASEDEKQSAKAFDGEKELVVIDEFAPMEIFSPAFVPAVEEALASNKGLIISTHAHRGHPLIHRIR